MKLWVDDVRPAPEGWLWAKTVWDAIKVIEESEPDIDFYGEPITLISLDHDAGLYYPMGGDFIRVLNWLEETGRNYPIRIHSANAVGVENMRRIIQRNNWKEVF